METPSVATKVEPNSSNALSENRRRIAGQRLAVETRKHDSQHAVREE